MDAFLITFLNELGSIVLIGVFALSLYVLGNGADLLVNQAVLLSKKLGISTMVIGATIVSLGTTLPEATVSVMAAIKGNPDLALGNAVGSIIANTALIIGLASLLGKLPVDQHLLKRQGRIKMGVVFLLAIICLPFSGLKVDRIIPQWMGFIFVALLVGYIFLSIKWSQGDKEAIDVDDEDIKANTVIAFIKLFIGIGLVIASSKVLIPVVEILATRIGVPQSVIASTLVALGTSLPELVTALTAVRRGHGELAVGNIVGADILNVLFVIGGAAAATRNGLIVPATFYVLQIPTMVLVVVLFRWFSGNKDSSINKKEGISLLTIYLLFLIANYSIF